MRLRNTLVVPAVLFLAASAVLLSRTTVDPVPPLKRFLAKAPPAVRAAGIRLPFITNEGQADPRVAFSAHTFGGPLFVTREGSLVYDLPVRAGAGAGWSGSGVALVEKPAGAFRARVEGRGEASARISEFVGRDPSRWRRGIRAFESVTLGDPWPGISLSVAARGNNVEKLFTLSPGADPAAIRMIVEGGTGLSVDGAGRLAVGTAKGTVRFTRPVAWQETGAGRRAVPVAYRVAGNAYGFELGAYDRSREVVIDPLLACTYLGGSATGVSDGTDDQPWALACDASGNLYVAGGTGSSDFPSKAGAYDNGYGAGGSKAFIVKLSSDLTTLQAATFYGGSGGDVATAMALRGGSVYIAGHTASSDLPVSSGCYDNSFTGNLNAFVAMFSADLSTLQAATYLGGGQEQWPKLALDPSGNVFVTGETYAGSFPLTDNAFQTTLHTDSGYGSEFFVSKLSGDLSTLLASTFLGSSPGGYDYGYDSRPAIAIDNQGRPYIGGYTEGGTFPTTTGAFDENPGPGYHIVRMDAGLTTVQVSTYLSGGHSSYPLQLALGAGGRVYASAWNHSGYGDFPTTPGTLMPVRLDNNAWEAGVAILSADLATVERGTYLGGSGNELPTGILVRPDGSVYVAGQTASSDFPVTAASYDNTLPTTHSVFVAHLDNDLATLLGSTYLPGSNPFGNDPRAQMAADPSGNVFVSWITNFAALPTTAGAFQPSFRNVAYTFDGAIAKFDANLTGGTATDNNAADNTATDNTSTASLAFASNHHGCQAAPGGGDFASFATTLLLFLPAALLILRKKARPSGPAAHPPPPA